MTITLTPEEFEKFYAALSKWYAERMQFVLSRLSYRPSAMDPFADRYCKDQYQALVAEFDKANPIPEWRNLL